MSSGLSAAACCLLASLAACTSLDLPPARESDEDGGRGSVVDTEDAAGDDADDDQGARPTPPSAKADSGTAGKDAGKQTPNGDAGSPIKPTPTVDGGSPTVNPTPDAGRQTASPTPDAGTTAPVVKDAGVAPSVPPDPVTPPPVVVMSVVPGSAAKAQCTSYGLASGSMCGGYFCGVTAAQIAAEMPANTLCGANAATSTCDNKLPKAVAKCARDVKSANAAATNAELRPKIQDCVFTDADLRARTPSACLSCYLDAAECDGDNCLIECLTGDSKGCDSCRAKNNCHSKAILCAMLPNPF